MKLAATKLARVIETARGPKDAEYAWELNSAICKTMEANPDLGTIALAARVDEDMRNGFLKDWALIELKGNEARDLSNLKNRIWANTDGLGTMTGREFDTDSEGFLQLRDVKPVQELLFGKSTKVVMRGGATNKMTWGMTNEIPAVTRIPQTERRGKMRPEEYAFQLMVIPPYDGYVGFEEIWGRHSFALPGDSGSVVSDTQGSIVGLVGGGAMGPGVRSGSHCKEHMTVEDRENCLMCDLLMGHDITFVNLMEHILSDIERITGKPPTIIGVEKEDLKERGIEDRMDLAGGAEHENGGEEEDGCEGGQSQGHKHGRGISVEEEEETGERERKRFCRCVTCITERS